MDRLQDRVHADLDGLNAYARQLLGETVIPPPGTWVRCWDLTLEGPVGEWHLITATDGTWRVSYRCLQVGIVTVINAVRSRQRFALHHRLAMPDANVCRRCSRD
jgi:hypothetical protein